MKAYQKETCKTIANYYGLDSQILIAIEEMSELTKELCKHQRKDYTIYSPIPGNWGSELPAQMLATIGLPGVWTYYMHTGDLATLAELYPYIRNYLSIWKLEENGLTAFRKIGWNWGDWGDNRDMRMIYAAWHYIALEAAARMAQVLGNPAESQYYRSQMARLKVGFNACWNGTAYRHPEYKEKTDDRVLDVRQIRPYLSLNIQTHWFPIVC